MNTLSFRKGEKMDVPIKLEDFCTLDKERGLIQKCITKIMNTLSFRKLSGKTQVILSLSGPTVRTRLTHTIEVAKIARDICKELKLNEDLAEAIALAHDIGHTPFGHVGERTLREVMCGCDTLKGQITDCDFNNSGFKHSLQSFRVLKDFERLDENNAEPELKKIWACIFWGAAAHSKMTWAKTKSDTKSDMDKEILISCEHCPKVFVCYFHEKKECKKNVQKKKETYKKNNANNSTPPQKNDVHDETISRKAICKPWYCANLPIVETEEETQQLIKAGKLKLSPDELIADFIHMENIHPDYVDEIYCSQKCYMAKLWKYKIYANDAFEKYKFLYDHPFPNSFYATYFHKFFYPDNKENIYWISVEAVIVSLADEIAQRQQDLEDGIQKNLISLEFAKEQVKKLVDPFLDENGKIISKEEIAKSKNQEELGRLLVKFYIDALTKATRRNLLDFANNNKKEGINIYCFINNIFSLDEYNGNLSAWIDNELSNLLDGENIKFDEELLTPYFSINDDTKYFCFIVYFYFEDCIKKNGIENYEILIKYIDFLKKEFSFKPKNSLEVKSPIESLLKKKKWLFIKHLEDIETLLKNNDFSEVYKDVYSEYNKKKYWRNITHFNIYQFYFFDQFIQMTDDLLMDKTTTTTKIINAFKKCFFKAENRFDFSNVYDAWKTKLGNSANQVLSNLVKFVSETEKTILIGKLKEDALEKFEEDQRITILHSEAVEKNDGKASYILKRLFKAFIANSHQLPDECLRIIIFNLVDCYKKFIAADEKSFEIIIHKLKLTTPEDDLIQKVLNLKFSLIAANKIAEQNAKNSIEEPETKKYEEYTIKLSNEINASLKERLSLYEFLVSINDNNKLKCLRKAIIKENDELQEKLRSFRKILDNPMLNANPFWKSILTRGICDYIASLTDQEAIDEYDKLYAGVMEIV